MPCEIPIPVPSSSSNQEESRPSLLQPDHHHISVHWPSHLRLPSPSINNLLPPERATLCETGLATGGLAQDLRAALAHNDCLGVREDGGDCEAAWALDVHEEGAWRWDERLEFVLAGLGGGRWVEEINCENHLESVCLSLKERVCMCCVCFRGD